MTMLKVFAIHGLNPYKHSPLHRHTTAFCNFSIFLAKLVLEVKDEKATNANAAGTNEGDKDSNNVDSELKLQELGYAVVDVATPHDSLDDAGEVVVRQDDV